MDRISEFLQNMGWIEWLIFLGGGTVIYLIVQWLWNKHRPKIIVLDPLETDGEPLTAENTATIVFRGVFKVKAVNGQAAVRYKPLKYKAASFLIPAGQTSINASFDNDAVHKVAIRESVQQALDFTVTRTTEAGKTYYMAYMLAKDTLLETKITFGLVECMDGELDLYVNPTDDDLPSFYKVKDAKTAEKAQQFMEDYCEKYKDGIERLEDIRENHKIESIIYAGFQSFGITLEPGEVYKYDTPKYGLLLSPAAVSNNMWVGYSRKKRSKSKGEEVERSE